MEIRNVVNEVKNEYPKMKQVTKKHLSKSIPRKWLKVGLSSLGIILVMENKVFAVSLSDFNGIEIAGGVSTKVPAPLLTPIQVYNIACLIVQRVSIVVFIMTGLRILINKIKSKKQPEPKKVKKWVKILFIISIIVFILSILSQFIINVIDYY